jgi:hypothetical protein
MLFIAPADQPISQDDVDWVIHQLGPLIGENRVYRWVAQHVKHSMDDAMKERQKKESKMALEKAKEEEEEQARKDRDEYVLRAEGLMDDGNSVDFDAEDEEDDEEDFQAYLDMEDDEDVEPAGDDE